MTAGPTAASLWLAVVGFGVYHGLNPAMGWPLAVAKGIESRRDRAVFATIAPLGAGHFLAMAVVLVPFALLAWIVHWSRAIQVGAGGVVVLFGIYRLIDRRHPRFLARVRPAQLAWWSFLAATAHGAGLMLVPIALGLCAASTAPPGDVGAQGALGAASATGAMGVMSAAGASVVTAVGVAAVHTLAMIGAGVTIAWLVYRWLGLRFVRKAWFDLDRVWGLSLVVTGVACVVLGLR